MLMTMSVRQGCAPTLITAGFRVIGKLFGRGAVEAAMDTADVMLMDLVMSGMGGVEATRKVKDITPRTNCGADLLSSG